MVRRVVSDVLVIGAGGAGLRAAIQVKMHGLDVALVSKAPAGMNNCTVVAGGGFRAALEGLTPEEHAKDTIFVGKALNDVELVEVFTKEGPARILEMRDYGVKVRVHRAGASVGSIPTLMGLGMTKPMVEHARSIGIKIIENTIITKLLKKSNRVTGGVGFDAKNEEPVTLSSKATVLATGGAGAIYNDKDIYGLSPEELKDIPNVASSLEDALEHLKADHAFLLKGDVFTQDLIEKWIEYKMEAEVDPVRMRPVPLEFQLYFDC